MNTMQNNGGDPINHSIKQNTGAGRGRLVEPVRGGRGDLGAGGGGGTLARRADTTARDEFGNVVKGSRRGKVISTRGGSSVRQTERQRLAGDAGARWSGNVESGAVIGAVVVTAASVDALPVAAALASPYPAAGQLLGEAQGQLVLAVCAAMSRKLLASMRRDGKQPSSTTGEDAAAAGAVAVARWRKINARFPRQRARGSLASVAWRAIVRESSRDILGDALALDDFTPSQLAASAVPLPGFTGDDSREDKAARLDYERTRAQRPARLAAALVGLNASGNGRRAEAVAKVGHAAALLLGGRRMDEAAQLAGFKARGNGRGAQRPADSLARAVKRLGLDYRTLRTVKDDFTGYNFERITIGRWSPLVPIETGAGVTVAGMVRRWSFAPSAGLPAQRGKLSGAVVKADSREARKARRVVERKATAARFAGRESVKADFARRSHRLAVRGAKLRGEFFGAFLPAVEPDGAAIRTARLLSEWRGKVWGAV